MRQALPLLFSALLLGCVNDTNFTKQQNDIEVVSGSGVLVLEPATVDLWGLTPEVTASETLVLNNLGDNNLVIYEARLISSGGGTFYLPTEWQTTERTIAPNQALEMIVAATLSEPGTAEGSLRIKSNDDTLERYVTLRATTDSAVGDTGATGGDTGATGGDTGGAGDSER